MITTCPECNHRFRVETERRKLAKPGIVEVGFACPGCGRWTRTHYDNQRLAKLRKGMEKAKARWQGTKRQKYLTQYNELKAKHQAEFDRLKAAMVDPD